MKVCKKISILLVAVILLTLACALLASCNNNSPTGVTPAPPKMTTYIAIDINPSVQFVVDQYGKVMNVSGANTDANVLLYNEGGIVGSPYGMAIENVLSLSKSYGYLGENTKNIGLTVVSADNTLSYADVSQAVEAAAAKCEAEINVCPENEVDVVLLEELKSLKEKDDRYENVDISTYRLMKQAQAGGLDEDEAVAGDFDKLVKAASASWEDTEAKLGQTYEYAVGEARFAYEQTRTFAKDTLYITYFSKKCVTSGWHIIDGIDYADRALTAIRYSVLHSTQLYFEHCSAVLKARKANPLLSSDDLKALYGGISSYTDKSYDECVDSLKDAEGNVSMRDVEAYVNTLYRNTDDKEGFEEAYHTVKTNVLDNVDTSLSEEEISEETNKISEAIHNFIFDKLPSALEKAYDFLKNLIFDKLPDWFISAKGIINDAVNAITDYDDPAVFDKIAANVGRKAQSAFRNMDISSNEAREIAELEDSIASVIQTAKDTCTEVINQIKSTALDWFENIKNAFKKQDDEIE